MFDPKVLGKRIKECRRKKDISQVALAKNAQITGPSISQIENGMRIPSTPVLFRISVALDTSIDYLVGGTSREDVEMIMDKKPIVDFYKGFIRLSPADQSTILCNIEFLRFLRKQRTQP